MNLNEIAARNPEVTALLLSDSPHTEVAQLLTDSGYSFTEAAVRRWRRAHEDDMEQLQIEGAVEEVEEHDVQAGDFEFSADDKAALHQRLDDALESVSADPDKVIGLRVSQWQNLTKDADGEAQIHTMQGVKFLVKTKDPEPEWPVVQPAARAEIHPVPVNAASRKDSSDKTAVILPDPQFGYRFYQDTHEYDPFHDDHAIDVSLQIVRDTAPDSILCLGDFLDLPAFGKYEQEPAFQATTQKSIDRGYEFLARLRAAAPDAQIAVMEGNHDRRLQNMITANARAAFGLRRAGVPASWPVLSVPYLCNFDQMETAYIEGYPAGEHWFNQNIRAIHGVKVRSGGSTAAAVVKEDDVSTVFGHIHRIESQYLTRQNYAGGRTLLAHSPGCLCRVDGSVPSAKGSTDLSGRSVESYENWQQGLSVLEYKPGDGPFSLHTAFIDTFRDHRCAFGGKVYYPNV